MPRERENPPVTLEEARATFLKYKYLYENDKSVAYNIITSNDIGETHEVIEKCNKSYYKSMMDAAKRVVDRMENNECN